MGESFTNAAKMTREISVGLSKVPGFTNSQRVGQALFVKGKDANVSLMSLNSIPFSQKIAEPKRQDSNRQQMNTAQ